MLIILTSAKTMTGTSKIKAPAGTMPRFAQEANEIALNMAQFSTDDLKKILKLNPKLALENYNRFQEFHTAEVHSLQALLAYTGVVFKNINPKDFTEDDFLYANDHLRIASICYGLLRPLDLIKPYRMEYPGETVTITPDGGILSDLSRAVSKEQEARCIFEYIYFARPDSQFDGVSVYAARIQAGRFLAMDSPVEADLVVGVPESGNAAALGYSLQSGIPYGTAFVKNGYVGRTFIKPKQSSRESSVKVKLNVLKEAVNGKRIIMIDDSIVRGTTSDRIVHMLREAGAKEVHVRISSPPFLWPCYFGTDVPAKDQLIANNRTVDEIRAMIGADSLGYLDIERLREMVDGLGICTGCFNGDYPMTPPTGDIRGDFDK